VGADEPAAVATVDFVEPLGSHNLVHVRMEAAGAASHAGESSTQSAELVVAQVPNSERPTPGSRIRLGIDPTDVYLFHPGSGVALTEVQLSPVARIS
jgi:ABC-type sugar transport system ATPase subunit